MRFAVVGTGFGEQHVDWLTSMPGVTVEALCYRNDRLRATRIAKRFSIPIIESDPFSVIRSGRVDAVAVVTPPETHEELLKAAIDAGLTVVSDKPLAVDGDAANRLARQAEERGSAAFVTFQWRANQALREVARMRRDGFFGRILQGDLTFHHDFLSGPETQWPWRHTRQSAGAGTLADQGVHLFDLLRWLTGDEWAVDHVRSSVAFAQRLHHTGTIAAETEDLADVLLSSASGIPARVFTSRVSAHRQLRVELNGTQGGVIAVLDPDDGSGRLHIHQRGAASQVKEFPADAMNIYQLCLSTESSLTEAPTFVDGARSQSLLDEAMRKIRTTSRT
ncbi:Gfo/Idh/MocA family protein [Streptomyces sp. NPDC058953]|uniref:Gfo/Idh/MocA family protein n=1 Tax=unclassified Streptomyces TaxID=2593676 RepID=UPI0036C61EF4